MASKYALQLCEKGHVDLRHTLKPRKKRMPSVRRVKVWIRKIHQLDLSPVRNEVGLARIFLIAHFPSLRKSRLMI